MPRGNPNWGKGHKKVGGKAKGSKNKSTLILNTFAQTIVEGGMEKFRDELEKLKGRDYVNAFTTFFEYVKPKLARTELVGKEGKELEIKVTHITTPDSGAKS